MPMTQLMPSDYCIVDITWKKYSMNQFTCNLETWSIKSSLQCSSRECHRQEENSETICKLKNTVVWI